MKCTEITTGTVYIEPITVFGLGIVEFSLVCLGSLALLIIVYSIIPKKSRPTTKNDTNSKSGKKERKQKTTKNKYERFDNDESEIDSQQP